MREYRGSTGYIDSQSHAPVTEVAKLCSMFTSMQSLFPKLTLAVQDLMTYFEHGTAQHKHCSTADQASIYQTTRSLLIKGNADPAQR